MAITAKIDVNDKDILGSLRDFLKNILDTDEIQSLLVPQHLPMRISALSATGYSQALQAGARSKPSPSALLPCNTF